MGRDLGDSIRRFPVRAFPYHLIYLPDAGDVYIVAFAHERQRPGYWRSRMTVHERPASRASLGPK